MIHPILLKLSKQQRLPQATLVVTRDPDTTHAGIKRFIQYYLCRQPQAEQPCGLCHSCQLMAHGEHPDIFNGIAEEGVIKVDEVRALSEFAHTTPATGTQQVVWIPLLERMNIAAQNAILKTLEEPNAHTVFIMSTQHTHQLLPTVRSRTILVRDNAMGTKPELSKFQQALNDVRSSRASVTQMAANWAKEDTLSRQLDRLMYVVADEIGRGAGCSHWWQVWDKLVMAQRMNEKAALNPELVLEDVLFTFCET